MTGPPGLLLCGIPSEPPLQMAAAALDRLGQRYVFLNQREFADSWCEFQIGDQGLTGNLWLGQEEFPLEGFASVYSRLMDYPLLPEYQQAMPGARTHCEQLHYTLLRWMEIAPGRVVNRSRPSASNHSKPYQAQLIRPYFEVPETLVTNDPQDLLAFWQANGRLIYKSTSGVRSIVQELKEEDLERLETMAWCPVQFQEKVDGLDVRVHVIGRTAIATAIESDGPDYRYAHRESGKPARLHPWPLAPDVEERAVALTGALGLEFAGIDLRVTGEGRYVCFEVNPSPAYSYYESETGQPISETLARHLAWLDDPE